MRRGFIPVCLNIVVRFDAVRFYGIPSVPCSSRTERRPAATERGREGRGPFFVQKTIYETMNKKKTQPYGCYGLLCIEFPMYQVRNHTKLRSWPFEQASFMPTEITSALSKAVEHGW